MMASLALTSQRAKIMNSIFDKNKKNDCIFCNYNSLPKSFLFLPKKNASAWGCLDINPTSKGHSLVITNKHHKSIGTISGEEWKGIGKLVREYTLLLKRKFSTIKGFNYVINSGKEAYQQIEHFHLHIIPKYKKNEGYILTIRQKAQEKKNLLKTYKELCNSLNKKKE